MMWLRGMLLSACLMGTAAWAATEVPTPPLPPAALEGAPGLQPRGQGSFRWFGLHIYDAALWLPASPAVSPAPPAAAPGFDISQPLVLRLRYARTLKGSDIAQRSIEEIERLGLGDAARRAGWLETMRKLFPDVSRGTTLTGVHLPGRGARFFLDQRLLGEVPDEAFSRAFFAIWLDARTSAPALREALLGKAPP